MRNWKIALMVLAMIMMGAWGMQLVSPLAKGQTIAAAPVFATQIVGGGNGIAIVNESSGSVTYCTSYVDVSPNNAVPNDSCKTLGGITPGVGTSSLSIGVATNTFFVINNQTGGILQCPSILTINSANASGNPTGGCVNLGMASR